MAKTARKPPAKKSTTRKPATKRPSARKPAEEPQVQSLQGRSRPEDVIKDNAEALNQRTGPLQPPEAPKPAGKPKLDPAHALGVLRDGIHPGTPFGYVHDGETQRDRLGVPYINKAEAAALKKDGLVTIEDSKIRPVA